MMKKFNLFAILFVAAYICNPASASTSTCYEYHVGAAPYIAHKGTYSASEAALDVTFGLTTTLSSPSDQTEYNYWPKNAAGGSEVVADAVPYADTWTWGGISAIGHLVGSTFYYVPSTLSTACTGSETYSVPTSPYVNISPATVWEGETAYFSWGATEATQCYANVTTPIGPIGVSVPLTVALSDSGTYFVHCTNYWGSSATVSDSLTVLDCPSSIAISPPNNPNPLDSQWSTNYSFLTSGSVTASTSQSVSWTITPQSPGGASAQPNSGSGTSLNFSLSFSVASGGSLSASTPLATQIFANHVPCSVNATNTIKQDTRDIVRQEYTNHSITVPGRSSFNAPVATTNFSVAEINVTAYPIIVGQPGDLAQDVRDEWNRLIGVELSTPPTNYGLILSSGWRNPERNEFFNGVNTSNHQYGGAVDLVISNVSSVASSTGLTTAELWCLLEDAGDNIGTGIPENLSTQVACTSSQITHVHTQI